MVEDTPTYLRDKSTLNKMKNKATIEEETAADDNFDEGGVIKF